MLRDGSSTQQVRILISARMSVDEATERSMNCSVGGCRKVVILDSGVFFLNIFYDTRTVRCDCHI